MTDAFRRGRVGLGLGVNQIAGAAGFLLGPVVGGLLTSISWEWVFFVNVPLGIFGTIWGVARLREPVALPARQRFDWLGSLTFALGLGCVLAAFSLIAFPAGGIGLVDTLFALGILGLTAFVVVELRAREPMLDPRLFRDRLFALANAANALNGLARGAVLFLLIFFLQGPYGKDPLTAGLMMAPFGLAFLVVGPVSGWLSDHHGARGLGTAGLLVSAVGLAGMATISERTPYWELALWMAIMGGGSGLFSSPNTNVIMTSVRPDRRGIAAGVRTMLMNTGQMLSVAVAFPLVFSKVPQDVMMRIFVYGGGLGPGTPAFDDFLGGLHAAFVVFGAISVAAAVMSALQPAHSPRVRAELAALEP